MFDTELITASHALADVTHSPFSLLRLFLCPSLVNMFIIPIIQWGVEGQSQLLKVSKWKSQNSQEGSQDFRPELLTTALFCGKGGCLVYNRTRNHPQTFLPSELMLYHAIQHLLYTKETLTERALILK